MANKFTYGYETEVIVSINKKELSMNEFVTLYKYEDYQRHRFPVQVLTLNLNIVSYNELIASMRDRDMCEVCIDIYERPIDRRAEDDTVTHNMATLRLVKSIVTKGYIDPINVELTKYDLDIIGLKDRNMPEDNKIVRIGLFDEKDLTCMNKNGIINAVLQSGYTVEQALVHGYNQMVDSSYGLCIAKPDNSSQSPHDTLVIPMGLTQYTKFLDTLHGIYNTDWNIYIRDKVLYLNNENKKDPFGMDDKWNILISKSMEKETLDIGIDRESKSISVRKDNVTYSKHRLGIGSTGHIVNNGNISYASSDKNDLVVHNTASNRRVKVSQGDRRDVVISLKGIAFTSNPTSLFNLLDEGKSRLYRISEHVEIVSRNGFFTKLGLFTYHQS